LLRDSKGFSQRNFGCKRLTANHLRSPFQVAQLRVSGHQRNSANRPRPGDSYRDERQSPSNFIHNQLEKDQPRRHSLSLWESAGAMPPPSAQADPNAAQRYSIRRTTMDKSGPFHSSEKKISRISFCIKMTSSSHNGS
jgi:hypothetical protein